MPEAIVTRVQTGVRLEASLLNVLKALAALKGMTLGDLLEGIVLHAFEGGCAFSEETLTQIRDLKKVYGLQLSAADSHGLVEEQARPARAGGKRAQTVKSTVSRTTGREPPVKSRSAIPAASISKAFQAGAKLPSSGKSINQSFRRSRR